MIHFWYWFQENWKDLFQAISALIVAGCAVSALHTWQKEFVGKKKIEFAAEFVEKAIDIKDFIAYVRSGFSSSSEEKEIEERLKKENSRIIKKSIHYLIPKYRILMNEDKIKRFLHLRVKALMYFGEESLKIYETINSILFKIKFKSELLYNEYEHLSSEKKEAYESVIWSSYSSDDEIAQEIEKAVEELKLNLEPLYQDKKFKWKKND